MDSVSTLGSSQSSIEKAERTLLRTQEAEKSKFFPTLTLTHERCFLFPTFTRRGYNISVWFTGMDDYSKMAFGLGEGSKKRSFPEPDE